MASRTTTDPLEILLEMGVDLDNLSEEEDYLSALKEAIATIQFQTKGAGDERATILQQEVVKVRKQRKAADPKFKARKTKISADSFKKGSATGINFAPKALPTSAIVPYKAPEPPVEEAEEKVKAEKKEEPKNLLAEIATSVTNIADILKDQYNLKKKDGEFDRKKAQRDKRKLDKENLKKGFGGLLSTFAKVTKPVGGFFDTILNFIKNIFIAKFLVKLLEWFSNPENQKKVQNIIEFLGKHWKKLLSLYLVFGTGLGRFIFRLSKLLITGAIKLTAAIAKLLAAKKLRGARGLSRFLGGRGGRLLSAGLATGLTVGGTLMGIDALGFNEGGEVQGPGGTDKVPAMLTAGEFVMSRGAVQKYGISELEAMNAAGGGTNLPKMMEGITYAAGGGMVGKEEGYEKPDKMLTPVDPFEVHKRYDDFGYRLGQINPETLMMSKEEMTEKTSMVSGTGGGTRQPRGQGGRVLGSSTARGNLGTRVYENGHLVKSFDRFGRMKEYGDPQGIMRVLAGLGDFLTGDMFDFDRRTDRGNVFETRIVTEEMGDGYRLKDDVTHKETIAAIGKPDLIKHKDQILKQLPEGTTIQQVMSGAAIPGVTSDQLLRILATSDAQKATNLKETRARQLDMAIRGIKPGEGMSMVAGDMTPAMIQGEATATKRHAELMMSTDPEKIAAYDKKHGEGAYSHNLKEKLFRTYGGGQTQPPAPLSMSRATLSQSQKRLAAPMQPTQPSVNFMPLPLPQTSSDAPPAPRGGSRTPEINAGDGSASKRKILGIF